MDITFWPDHWAPILLPHAPIAELIVRGAAIYVFLWAVLRIAPRRQMSSFAVSDFLVLLLLATAVRDGLTGQHYGVGDAMITALVLIVMDRLLDALIWSFPAARGFLRAAPLEVIADGRLNERAMRKEKLTESELMEKLREHGVDEVGRVKRACIEPDGRLSVVKREP